MFYLVEDQGYKPFSELDFSHFIYMAADMSIGSLALHQWLMLNEVTPDILIAKESFKLSIESAIKYGSSIKKRMYQFIELSRDQEKDLSLLGAIGFTLLNIAGENFTDKDFSRTRLNGAILTDAIIQRCDFTQADLSDVDLSNSLLIQNNFIDAKISRENLNQNQNNLNDIFNEALSFDKHIDLAISMVSNDELSFQHL